MDQKHIPIDWDKLLENLEQDQSAGKLLTAEEQELLVELRAIKTEASDILQHYSNFNREKHWEELKAHIQKSDHKNSIYKLWLRIAIAASVITALSTGLYFYLTSVSGPVQYFSAKNEIPAGKNAATLILANGRKIFLSDAINGQLVKQSGISVTKTANGQLIYSITADPENHAEKPSSDKVLYNTLSTAKGEQYQVILPDGSHVWLNAASTLKFPVTFSGIKERKVELNGEAYFEIAKVYAGSKRVPFLVNSSSQTVEVLGTHFNINSYPDESAVKTTLLEGSVHVSFSSPVILQLPSSSSAGKSNRQSPDNAVQDNVILKPGQQSSLSNNQLKVKPVSTESVIDWKNGEFVLKDEDFKTTMRKIARWYNVEIVYEQSVPDDITLAGWVSRKSNVAVVLKQIERASKLNFKIEGRRITVSK